MNVDLALLVIFVSFIIMGLNSGPAANFAGMESVKL